MPFDVDLGKGPDGRTLATYSRCSMEPAAVEVNGLPRWPEGAGCTLRVYSFADRRERAVRDTRATGASEFLPSVWGNQIAFFRKPASKTHRQPLPQMLLGRLDGTGRLRRLPAVKVPKLPPALGGVKWLAPTALDLVSDRIVYGWEWNGEGYGHGMTEVRFLPSLNARRSVLIEFGVVGEGCLHTLVSPVLDQRFITMGKRETCRRPSVERYGLTSGRRYKAMVPSDPVALARSLQSPPTTATLLIAAPPSFAEPIDACTSEPSAPQAPPRGSCNLTELHDLQFSPAARRGPLPESFDEAP